MINLDKDEVVHQSDFEVVKSGADLKPKMLRETGAKGLTGAMTPCVQALSKSKGGGKGSPELEAAKLAWDIIKDNKPVAEATGASTSVLYKGTDPMDYEGAKSFESPTYRYRVTDSLIKDWVLVSADLRLEGTYLATPRKSDIPHGFYLPSVNFRILDMMVGWSFKLSADASVAPPANVGTGGVIQPRVRVYANLNMGWIFTAKPTSVSFEADGKLGGVQGNWTTSGIGRRV